MKAKTRRFVSKAHKRKFITFEQRVAKIGMVRRQSASASGELMVYYDEFVSITPAIIKKIKKSLKNNITFDLARTGTDLTVACWWFGGAYQNPKQVINLSAV